MRCDLIDFNITCPDVVNDMNQFTDGVTWLYELINERSN